MKWSVGATDSARFHPNADLPRSRFSDQPLHHSKLARLINFDCFICNFHLCVPLLCISFRLRDIWITATFNLFLFPSIREGMEYNSQASRHPLRNARESLLHRDRLASHLSDLKRYSDSPRDSEKAGVQRVYSTRRSPVFSIRPLRMNTVDFQRAAVSIRKVIDQATSQSRLCRGTYFISTGRDSTRLTRLAQTKMHTGMGGMTSSGTP